MYCYFLLQLRNISDSLRENDSNLKVEAVWREGPRSRTNDPALTGASPLWSPSNPGGWSPLTAALPLAGSFLHNYTE